MSAILYWVLSVCIFRIPLSFSYYGAKSYSFWSTNTWLVDCGNGLVSLMLNGPGGCIQEYLWRCGLVRYTCIV